VRKAWWLLRTELLSEARSLERTSTLALFAVAVLLTFHFTLPPEAEARPQVAGGFMWATIVFASLLELRRSFEGERREGTLDGLRVAPVDPGVIFFAKLTSNLVVVGILVAALAPLTALFFGARLSGVPAAIGVGLLAAIGLLAWGTLFAAAAGGTRSAEVLLPLVLFPLVVPQTIGCVRLLAHYLGGGTADDPLTAFVLLGGTAVLSVGTSLLLFEYVVEE
jgi:heme exporter protein B